MELYIHIPFCRKKCRYCDFPSFAGCEHLMPAYVRRLTEEIRSRGEELGHPTLETVFMGGGTPSLLPPELLEAVFSAVRESFPLAADAEITSEANPGTLTREWLQCGVGQGINRLSLGMQAAQDRLTAMLGRIHRQEQVAESVALARESGIADLNLDLMFGLPGQTRADWRESLEAALSLAPCHLSCYGLIPEEGTPLLKDLEEGRLTLPPEEEERAMYDEALSLLAKQGLQQYEISNFALPGKECRHNLGYWTGAFYLGVGSSAASMLPDPTGEFFCLRPANPASLEDYLAGERGEIPKITREEARFETVMLGLRLTRGVREADFLSLHGISLESWCGPALERQTARGLLEHREGYWHLTRQGMDLMNTVLVDIMEETDS